MTPQSGYTWDDWHREVNKHLKSLNARLKKTEAWFEADKPDGRPMLVDAIASTIAKVRREARDGDDALRRELGLQSKQPEKPRIRGPHRLGIRL